MSDGRTVWWAKDSAWWRRERIVELGEEFGPAGPAVVDWLACEAKAQNAGGRVQAGCRTVARGCFVEVVTVGHVLSRAVTLGLLDDFTDDSGRFECRISGWAAEQERVKAAVRKAEQRGRGPVGKGDPPPGSRSVTAGHAASRPVTECPPTGQDRTEPEKNGNSNAELRSATVDCFTYWQDRCGHQQAALSDDRRSKIETRLRERRRHHDGDLAAAIRDVRLAIDGAAIAPYVDERGKRHDEITLVCRNNSKLEDFMGRASAEPTGNVVEMRRSDALDRMDDFKRFYPPAAS